MNNTVPPLQETSPTVRESTLAAYRSAVVRVIQAMKGRLDEPFSLKSMAKAAYSSPYHFNRTFRRITGIPPCQYLWALRLEAATRRLAATEDSVLNVCYDVGYSSLGTFTRRFTELFGIPPARFRALSRAIDDHQACLDGVLQQQPAPADAEGQIEGCLDGWIDYPEGFAGPSAVALFTDPIPQGRPVACCFPAGSGAFRISGVPDGRYYLFALGIPGGMSLCDTQAMPRAGGSRIVVSKGRANGTASLSLRAPQSTDPPILVAMPVLLQQLATQKLADSAAAASEAAQAMVVCANGN